MFSIMTGMPLVFEFLLENQSKVNLQDEWGYTALTFAAKNKNRSVQVHFSISLYLSLSLSLFLPYTYTHMQVLRLLEAGIFE